MKRFAAALTIVFVAQAVLAEKGVFVRDAIGVRSYPPPPRLAERAKGPVGIELAAAETDDRERLQAMREWNARGGVPARIGFSRALPEPVAMRVGATASSARGILAATDRNTIVWSTVVRVSGADRLRLHLENVQLPAEATLWVYGPGDDVQGFGRELVDENGSLWAPSTIGDQVTLELEIPVGMTASFDIREVAEMFDSRPATPKPDDQPSCLLDSTCTQASAFPGIAFARRATAHLEWPKGNGFIGICSGGLLGNDVANDFTPYFLTANHCFSTQTTATTVEFFFDFQTTSCNGNSNIGSSKKVVGAQLLATSASTDFTFLRLNSIPAGRTLLDWTASAVPNGTKLYRISHPAPDDFPIYPQMYSTSIVNTSVGTCNFDPPTNAAPRPRYIYSTASQGGTYGGSSGSPVMLADGTVVGQLLGGCPTGGANPNDGCDSRNSTVDGALSATFPSIAQWLSPGSSVQPQPCVESATQVCLVNNRFGVKVAFNDGSAKTATAIEYTPDSALFWFFDKNNIEVLVKLINACGFNQRFWVYSGGTTDLAVTITVTDSKTGTVKTYNHAAGKPFATITDAGAFATCP